MTGFRRQIGVMTLAACYAVLTIASHGLHDLGGCTDGRCGRDAANAAANSRHCCDHGPAHDGLARQDRAGTSFRSFARGHDAATCAACALIAKLKTSQVAAVAVVRYDAPAAAPAPIDETFLARAIARILSARGPTAFVA